MADIPVLRTDGRNWTDYREKILRVAAQQNLDRLYDGTETLQGDAEDWQQRNAINLFEQDIATLELLRELRNNRTKRDTAYSPESTNYHVRTRNVGDTSHRHDEVSHKSRRREDDVPRSEPRPERKREPTSQGRVEKRPRVGEKGRESRGRDDERVAAASEPGNGATDQTTSGVSLVKPTSSQGNSPRARVDTPPSPPLPPTTPTIPVDQTAPVSRRLNDQRHRDGRVPCTETHRTREDGEGSRRGVVESRNRGSRADDEDGDDNNIHHGHVEPQQPHTVSQTAVDDEAADTTDPHAICAGTTVPAGTSHEPSNDVDEGVEEGDRKVEEEDEKGGRASESAALSSNEDGGDEDVRHAYIVPKPVPPSPYQVPPPPDESRPPPSTPLEGEKNGQPSSGRTDETGTHLETPQDQSRTTSPIRTPHDKGSSGEGRGVVIGHRQTVGEEDKVGERYNNTKTSGRVEERQSRREEARDEARDDKEGREYTTTEARDLPPESPPFPHHPALPPPSPIHPKRPDDVDTVRTCKMAARRRADAVHDPGGKTKKPPSVRLEGESGRWSSLHVETDDLKTCKTAAQRMCANAVHDPGGETDAPGSQPPSVRLEGEKDKALSLYVEAYHVEADDDDAGTVDHDHDTQQSPRRPVGMPDGDEPRPNGPTEPPDEKEGDRGVDGESSRVEGVEGVETQTSSRVDEPGGKGDERDDEESRTNDTGDATSSASCDSLRVETGALSDDEASQQCNGKPRASTNSPEPSTPPTPHPYDTKRPTHLTNPPRRRGQLKMLPTNISKPEPQPDATEAAQGYWGSVPEPPQSRSKGTEARTSTPHTVDITHTRKLPYRVIMPA
ncbi:hypothetical protein PAXINDRAFT_13553 [Paxillus involutus ATCC 200175]|uniref:Uncharacterized protein n=1 Tax=Paxillus involutus ATCC 200175 TaxID=664439 RepID=A0A0C9U1R3_PAXIN|nr:hypothetical protein PAXINDRAFT_13553 [Paxillus involutus ATCC 200175]